MTPEQKARQTIDEYLQAAGWEVQDREQMNLFIPGRPGVAVREAHLKSGFADYLLFVDGKALGVIEAKKAGVPLSGVESQSEKYAAGLPAHITAWLPAQPLPFLYQSTGIESYFTSGLDPQPRSRPVFAFHRPDTLREWVQQPAGLRQRLGEMPPLDAAGLWQPQFEAIRNLEQSLAHDRPRALIQMATGSGKTFTAVNFIYRLIRHAGARRILFLVDRNNLGRQAYTEFTQFHSPEGRKFAELYNIRHLTGNVIDVERDVNRVYIATIQRLYALLRDEELEEEAESHSLYEAEERGEQARVPRTVTFRGRLPIEFYDFIVIDECHRSIYTIWKQVLDYFDAYYIGLTATPGKQAIGFFDQNLVMEYSHEKAVADGINVAGEVYRIRTRITEEGSRLEAGEWVDIRDKRTRDARQELLDEELVYTPEQLDRSVQSASQIRTIIRHYRDVLFTSLFPDRPEHIVPKTLIFAKDDNHAEEIVRIARVEFAAGNDFCQKITYRADRNPEQILAEFRNSYNPRIAVTVDMIATGTDVQAIEVLLFMRQVRSRGYFEQMRGRGTRVISEDSLRAVTSDAKYKSHFVLIDAVGLTEAGLLETTPTLNRQRSVPLNRLLEQVGYGQHDEDLLATLAGRLARLEHKMTADDRALIAQVSGGLSVPELIHDLLGALDYDNQLAAAREATGEAEPGPQAVAAASEALCIQAANALSANPALRAGLLEIYERNEIILDKVSEDALLAAGYDAAASERLRDTVTSFRNFIEQHKDEIAALSILYHQPSNVQALTLAQLRELAEAMRRPPYLWTEEGLWNAYAQLERDRVRGLSDRRVLTDLVSLVRHALQPEGELSPYPQLVQGRYQAWLRAEEAAGRQFTAEQRWWLDKIAEFIGLNLSIGPGDFEVDGEFVNRGGRWGYVDQFGHEWQGVLFEMNEVLR